MSELLKKVSGIIGVGAVIVAVIVGLTTGNVVGGLLYCVGGLLAALGFYAAGVHFENQEITIELLKEIEAHISRDAGKGGEKGTKTYGAVPVQKLNPIARATQGDEPWICGNCGKSNDPSYKACSNCHSPR